MDHLANQVCAGLERGVSEARRAAGEAAGKLQSEAEAERAALVERLAAERAAAVAEAEERHAKKVGNILLGRDGGGVLTCAKKRPQSKAPETGCSSHIAHTLHTQLVAFPGGRAGGGGVGRPRGVGRVAAGQGQRESGRGGGSERGAATCGIARTRRVRPVRRSCCGMLDV